MATAIIDAPVISGFLDVISSDVATASNRQDCADRHVYGLSRASNWRSPKYRELGLLAHRSRPDRLAFYGQDGPRWFEVIATRAGDGWRIKPRGDAPADLPRWLA